MDRSHASFVRMGCRIVFVACALLAPLRALAQAAPPQSRIVDRVDENVLVALRGNTHPLAQRQFDRGAAPADLPMARMLLVLKRSAAQEAALEKLLDDQQDQNSPSYHQWLTPDAFGQQFGPGDQDVQTVAAWLRSHDFQIGMIGRGRTVIEFSGTAVQVQQAFHTAIHKYTVNGEDHWANASDPQIPAAIEPVVVGVASLHNFPKRPMNRVAGKFMKDRTTGVVSSLGAEFTTVDSNLCPGVGNCYFVGPYDFAKIYNILPLWNAATPIDGTGQSIAVADESNINVQDARDFRNLFGLPPNDPQVILDGADPGLVPGLETESLLDVEWAGAVAKGATIKLVVSAPTNSTEGADLAAVYAIENNLAPVVSESFGDCELDLGDAGNSFENLIREQAAAQGITFITASGDQGSATCDGFSGTTPEPATFGLAVSGLASSPYGVAVGGTDFLNFGTSYDFQSPSIYWSATNDANQASALGYVPETTWNDSCTNNVFVVLGAGSTPEASCNNSQLSVGVITAGGGGGKSNCPTSTGTSPSNCVNGYSKPSWQAAPGVPADSARDIPDVSLFSADGLMTSAYVICEADMFSGHGSCSLSQPNYTFVGIGGTSGSAPAFAGIVALVNQSTGSSGQGNANYVLYKLASSSTQTSQNCNATGAGSPAAGCIFQDITSGTIAMPCARSSPNCNFSNSSDTFGVLSGYSAGTGYDLATGLGSVNASNLVHDWIQPTLISTTTLSLNGGKAVSITHGQSIPFDITVTPGAATGTVSLEGTPTGSGSVPMASFPLQNGSASGTTAALAGGASYAVIAHYSGNGTYKPSDSSAVTVSVTPEPSTTLITIPVFDPNTGNETGNTPSSIVYGTPTAVRVDVGNASAKTTFPSQLVCALLTCPTGNITLSDSVNGASATLLSPSGGFPLGSGGYVLDYNTAVLPGGAHQLSASYPGDSSYKSSTGTYALTVTPAPMQVVFFYAPNSALVGASVNLYATFNATNSFPGAGPTGTITFYDGGAQIPGTVTYGNSQPGSANSQASLTGFLNPTFTTVGSHQLTAKYSGDPNYGAATSSATTISLLYSTSESGTANPTTVNLGQNVNITATVTGASTTPPMTGTFQFFLSNGVIPSGTVTQGTDANGNQTLTATVTATPQYSQGVTANYSGDATYTSNSTSIFVNVNIPDFNLPSPSSPLLITAGMPGSMPIAVVPLSSIASAVSMSCQGNLPVGYSCGFSPSTVNLSNGVNGTTTLSLNPNPPAVNAMSLHESVAHLAVDARSVPGNVKSGSLIVGFVLLLLLLWPGRSLGRRWKVGLATACVFCFIVGCGGSSSAGGGPPNPLPTTTTVSSSASKVASQASVTFTATITGSASSAPTGNVIFLLNGGFAGLAALVGNSATLMTQISAPGIYALSAQYSGDALNQSSTSIAQNVLVTGSTVVTIQGQTSNLTHFANVTVTLQ
jgi:hypothetical protein